MQDKRKVVPHARVLLVVDRAILLGYSLTREMCEVLLPF